MTYRKSADFNTTDQIENKIKQAGFEIQSHQNILMNNISNRNR